MTALIFATNNKNKVEEINAIVPDYITVISLKEAGILIEIPEPHDTLEKNAQEKATVIFQLTQKNCFSEDTGLEVMALNGAPGVLSARYAGSEGDSEKNIQKLLHELEGVENRTARFRTVISLIFENKEFLFEGICEGRIIKEKKGTLGFGYDAVFIPEGSHKTFAEMEMTEKNFFSHRKKATAKLISFLNEYYGKD
jgi:XTP/dITP diphosphohydrolase